MDGATRDERWDLRVAARENEAVRRAAQAAETSFTDFVRSAAIKEAEMVLADRTHFGLEPVEWQRFNELLERPPRVPEGLRELFASPSVFE